MEVQGRGRTEMARVCCAAVPGTTTRRTCVLLTGTRTHLTTATTTLAFVVPELKQGSADPYLNRLRSWSSTVAVDANRIRQNPMGYRCVSQQQQLLKTRRWSAL